METKEITLHVKFVAYLDEGMGYVSFVFEDLEFQNFNYKYRTLIKFPNWNYHAFNIGDEGFVSFKIVKEGVDEWYDGSKLVKYNNDNLIFLKFIPLKSKVDKSEIILD